MSLKAWPDGPREWSPRMKQALEDIKKLRSAIPPELIVERGNLFETGGTFMSSIDNELTRVALVVKVGQRMVDEFDRVWLHASGRIFVGPWIHHLLNGYLEGYEHLAGRWPWPGAYGPPDPKDPLGRYT